MSRRRVAKTAAPAVLPGQQKLFVQEQLADMPLAAGRVAKAALVFGQGHADLVLHNLEEPITWRLKVARDPRISAEDLAKGFDPSGSRVSRVFKDVPATFMQAGPDVANGAPLAFEGMAEFGLQTDDDKEYFLSKFGDLVGVVRVKRSAKGWNAGLAKSNVPRVLSDEAVKNGLMPPTGHSALPKSLEAVVPSEYQYWKAQGDDARAIRDALVENGFFNEDCIKAVDGELRKVEVKFYLYEPPTDVMTATKRAPSVPTFGARVTGIVPPEFLGKAHTPMLSDDWLEFLDAVVKGDEAGDQLVILSPPDRTVSAREMARAVKTIKSHFLIEHNDTRENRAAFAQAGAVFKLQGVPDRVLCASFPVYGVTKLDDGPVAKTVTFQGVKIDIDRPVGFVQTGKDADGNDWSRTFLYDYGFFPGTKGGDGDNIDVFVGPDEAAPAAFFVTQKKEDGSFDEYKVFVGFESEQAALTAYAAHIPTKYFDGIATVPMGALKGMLGLEPMAMTKRVATYVRKINGVSYDQLRSVLQDAVRDAYPAEKDDNAYPCGGPYVEDLYDDAVIFSQKGACYQQNYAYANGAATLDGQAVEVVRGWMPKAQLGQAGATKSFKVSTKKEITHRKDGYHVLSEDGAKHLGGPYDSKADAVERLRQVEGHKTSKIEIRFAKSHVEKDGDEHYVLGVVLEPDVVDAQNDTYDEPAVRKACERFMEQHRNMGLMHKSNVNDKVQILENYIAPADFQIGDQHVKKGSWMMAVRVNDDALWKAVKAGELTGFSIGGSAIRKPVEEGV